MAKLTALKRIRESKFLTQRELAEKAGRSEAAIVRLEKLQADARPSTIRALAAALGVEPQELVGDE